MADYAGSNDRRAYALTCIDMFSKYAWVVPITRKRAETVLAAIEPILREHTPKLLHSDNGGEFVNAQMEVLLDELNIKHVKGFPYKPSTQGAIERFNRTFKGMIAQHMSTHNTRRWITVCADLVTNYNNTLHTTIKTTPAKLFAGERVGTARKNIKAGAAKMLATTTKTRGVSTNMATIGSYVRINLIKADGAQRELDLKGFRKAFGRNCTNNVYLVESVIPKSNSRDEYLLSESYIWEQGRTGAGKFVHGDKQLLNQVFYASELLVVPKPTI